MPAWRAGCLRLLALLKDILEKRDKVYAFGPEITVLLDVPGNLLPATLEWKSDDDPVKAEDVDAPLAKLVVGVMDAAVHIEVRPVGNRDWAESGEEVGSGFRMRGRWVKVSERELTCVTSAFGYPTLPALMHTTGSRVFCLLTSTHSTCPPDSS